MKTFSVMSPFFARSRLRDIERREAEPPKKVAAPQYCTVQIRIYLPDPDLTLGLYTQFYNLYFL